MTELLPQDRLRQIAREGDVILFKGSRGTHVERALERFLSPPAPRQGADRS